MSARKQAAANRGKAQAKRAAAKKTVGNLTYTGKKSKPAASISYDPTGAIRKSLAKRAATVKGAEGPKRSVKGPVKGKAGGRGVAMNKPAKKKAR